MKSNHTHFSYHIVHICSPPAATTATSRRNASMETSKAERHEKFQGQSMCYRHTMQCGWARFLAWNDNHDDKSRNTKSQQQKAGNAYAPIQMTAESCFVVWWNRNYIINVCFVFHLHRCHFFPRAVRKRVAAITLQKKR